MQANTFGEKLLRRTIYGVRVEGVECVMTLGDKACRMDWRTARNLSIMLFHAAKDAKKAAGDEGIEIVGLARLTDANADELQVQFNRDRTASFNRVR